MNDENYDEILEIVIKRDEKSYKEYVRNMFKDDISVKDIIFINHVMGIKMQQRFLAMNSDVEKLLVIRFMNEMTIWYMEEYKEDLERTEKAYGVDGRIITAIILVESAFGASVGTRSTLNTLSTIASLAEADVRSAFWEMIPDDKRPPRKKFENQAKRRSAWAYKELKAFLKYAYRQRLDPAEIPGSFAGAMGFPQFMPSSVLAYGEDGNNDGTIDLNTHADSMASIANYLKSHGWRPGISPEKAQKIIYHYNHSEYYVKAILKIAARLES